MRRPLSADRVTGLLVFLQRSHTSGSLRPKSHRTVSSTSRPHAEDSGTSTPLRPPLNNDVTNQHQTELPNGAGTVGDQLTTVRHQNASPKSVRKVLPKPKPPAVKKVRRTSQTSLHSRSTDNLHDSVTSQSHPPGTSQATMNHHRVPLANDNDSSAAGSDSHDSHTRTSASTNSTKVLPKPKPLREWSNTANHKSNSLTSRRPILKKRQQVSQQVDEHEDELADPAAIKPASLNMTHVNKRYMY